MMLLVRYLYRGRLEKGVVDDVSHWLSMLSTVGACSFELQCTEPQATSEANQSSFKDLLGGVEGLRDAGWQWFAPCTIQSRCVKFQDS
eukprot:5078159-Amphidinium_carterae.1